MGKKNASIISYLSQQKKGGEGAFLRSLLAGSAENRRVRWKVGYQNFVHRKKKERRGRPHLKLVKKGTELGASVVSLLSRKEEGRKKFVVLMAGKKY